MISNFERFHEIQKQADSESYSSLCHVEPRNLPRSPYLWPRWSGPLSLQMCYKYPLAIDKIICDKNVWAWVSSQWFFTWNELKKSTHFCWIGWLFLDSYYRYWSFYNIWKIFLNFHILVPFDPKLYIFLLHEKF